MDIYVRSTPLSGLTILDQHPYSAISATFPTMDNKLPEKILRNTLEAWLYDITPEDNTFSYDRPQQDLNDWFKFIEEGCEDWEIPHSQRVDAGLFFLSGDLKTAMVEGNNELQLWSWSDFQHNLAG